MKFNQNRGQHNRLGFLSLALLVLTTQVKGWVQICDERMKYCNSMGGYDQVMDYTLFEGQISLFDTGFFIYMDETRSAYLNTNAYCSSSSYTSKQRAIQSIFQIGNIENRFDENENPDSLWYYTNGNSQTVLDTFIGNVIPFQTCAYVFNMAYLNGKKSYNLKRYTISIEYQQDILKKKTVLNLEADYTFNQLASAINHEDFPCGIPQFTFHPGINALMYMMDDQKTIVVKADRSYPAGNGIFTDMCSNYLLQNQAQISQFSFDIKAIIEAQLAFKVRDTLKNWVFLNGSMYMVAQGYQLDYGSTTQQSMIVKVNIQPTSNTAATITVVNMAKMYGTINQIASLELMGLVYTLSDVNVTGIQIAKVNLETYSSIIGYASPITTDTWKIYQTKVDNHLHRPIFAVPLTAVSKLYRVTTRLELLIDDTTLSTDFYHFNLQVARYRALIVNPGTCAQTRNSANYNNLKAYVLNLRRMEVERCIDLALTGCGDGKMQARYGETCDDGNLESGDGCSNQCAVEYMWSCTQQEGQLSVCTPITCGNGKADPGEECDDFNFVDNDGCTKCVIDLGYKCLNTTCTLACGDGKIQRQTRIDPVTSLPFFAYNEECDKVNGCVNSTCKPVLGWTCTVVNATMTSYCNQTCGNNKNDPKEVCDDGNNVSGDGCAEGCLVVEPAWTCPLVGPCLKYCGNGEFEGNDTSIGKIDGISTEQCDDGNNLDEDGCSKVCNIEPGWKCRQVFQGLKLEIPSFKSECTKITNDTTVTDTSKQYFRNIYAFEYTYTNNAVVNSTTGKFRLIEHPSDMDLYGVTFVGSGNDKSGTQFAYEYTKVKQKVGGAVSYFETKVDMMPKANVNQEAVTRNTFGPLYVKSTSPTQISFFTYIGTQFQKFFTSTGSQISRLLGTPFVFWWPKFNTLMVRKIDGSDWKTFRVDNKVVDIAMNPQNYVEADQIESGGNKNDMKIAGQFSVEPLFANQYMLPYCQHQGISGGTAQILKYYDQIDYLGEYNEKRTFSETNTRYFAYSLVYVDDDFGSIFKSANSSLIYRLTVPSMESKLVQLNPNGYFSSENIAFMTFIQRRDDPWADPTLQKDIYGYFDSKQIYQFIINPLDATEIITVDAIDLPKLGLMIQYNRMIDVGQYHLAVYSGVQCGAVVDISKITGSSAWFYTFSTREWSCMDLANDPVLFDQSFYGWSVITPPIPTPSPPAPAV